VLYVPFSGTVVHQTAETAGVVVAVADGDLVVMLQMLVLQIC
jgi:hypothetical protein